jgi:Ankyrin repeats (3 copies)/Ankyrin repeat
MEQNRHILDGYHRRSDLIETLLRLICIAHRDFEIVKLLLTKYNAAATVNTISNQYSALHLAVRLCNMKGAFQHTRKRSRHESDSVRIFRTEATIRLLLEHGADVNLKSTCRMGMTPFHSAVVDSCNVMILLYPHVTDINVKDNFGNTPLYWAITDANIEAVQLLLQHPEIDLLTTDVDGCSPLRLAIRMYENNTDTDPDDDPNYDRFVRDSKRILDMVQDAIAKRIRQHVYAGLIMWCPEWEEDQTLSSNRTTQNKKKKKKKKKKK